MSDALQYLQQDYELSYQEKCMGELSRISELESYIKETVIGQDEVVASIATSLYNSLFLDLKCVDLIIGPSGTGKTLIMEQFCKEMGLVYTIESATQYTEEGYVGDSVDQMISNLITNSKGKVSVAERGILIIDEIGKKASKEVTTKDVSGKGVQQALLPILSGATINVTVGEGISKCKIPFDTSKLKIFLMDAFVGIDEIREKRLKKARNETLGFSVPTAKLTEDTLAPERIPYTKEDLIEYGLMPELVGRINKLHIMNPITKEIKIEILKFSKKSRFKEYELGFSKMGIKLNYEEPDIFEEIAESTPDYQTGARELSNTVNYMFEKVCHSIYDSTQSISNVFLLKGITKDNTKYILQ